MPLSHAELRSIGEKAIEEIVGGVGNVEVVFGLNEEGDPAYFFDVAIDQDRDRARASLLRIRLRQKIRDLLLAEQDANYPYVRVHSSEQ